MATADVVSSPPETESPVIDGKFRIRISRDAYEIFLDELTPPAGGGKPVTPSLILAKLKKLKVQCTVDSAALDQALTQVNSGAALATGAKVVIARGRPAHDGQDGALQWLVEPAAEGLPRVARPQQPVARYRPATAGQPGADVFGKKTRARDGVDLVTSTGQGISVVNSGDEREFVAGIYGCVDVANGVITIDPHLKVAPDKLSATMSLYPLRAEALTVPHVVETLAVLGVRHGVNERVLEESLTTLNHGRNPQLDVLVAHGQAAVDEQVQTIAWNIPFSTVQSGMSVVLGGDRLLEYTLPTTTPSDGMSVYGEPIKAKRSSHATLQAGAGVEARQEPSGQVTFAAQHYGRLMLREGVLSVEIPLYVDDDRMKATMDVYKASSVPGHRLCGESDLTDALKSRGVVFGVQSDTMGQALQQLQTSNALLLRRVIVAKGRPAVDGVDESLELVNNVSAGKVLPSGRIDFHDHNYPLNVTAGAVVARRIASKPAQDGCDVLGSSIAGRVPNALALELDGVEQRPDGALVALRDGALMLGGGSLAVTDLLVVDGDVGPATGNIDAKLNVHVKGYVLAGYRVVSSADVVVKDNIEQARVSSAGSLIVHGGIRGAECQVSADSLVQAAFVELAALRCKGDVAVAKGLVNADVRAGAAVRLGDPSKGTIMGGHVRAQSGISAAVLGSVACVKTRLELELPAEPVETLAAVKAKIEKTRADLSGLEGLCTQCSVDGVENGNQTCRKICNTTEAMREELEELKQQRDDLIMSLAQLKKGRVRVSKRVFPGVQIRLYGAVRNVDKELGPGEFYLKGDEVAFEPR